MTAKDVILEVIFPVLGGIVGLIMFASPTKAVLRVRSQRTLEKLNPLPMPAILANCIGWLGYSFVIRNYYIFWVNELGMLLGWFFTVSCYGVAPTKTKDRLLAIVLFFTVILSVIAAVGSFARMSEDGLQLLWGYTANGILVVYYTAPLSTLFSVIRSKNASSIHWPMALMNFINGSLWLGYGLAIQDLFVAVPNGVGALFGAMLLAFVVIFNKRSTMVLKNLGGPVYHSSVEEPVDADKASMESLEERVKASADLVDPHCSTLGNVP